MKQLIALLPILFVFLLSACKEEPECDNPCFNNGYCEHGSCICPEGYSGADCSEIIRPKKVRIEEIIVTHFPEFNDEGNNWDSTSGADLAVSLMDKWGMTVYAHNGYITNAKHNTEHHFEVSPPMLCTLNEMLFLAIYDHDTNDPEAIGAITFMAWPESSPPLLYQKIGSGDYQAIIVLSYEY